MLSSQLCDRFRWECETFSIDSPYNVLPVHINFMTITPKLYDWERPKHSHVCPNPYLNNFSSNKYIAECQKRINISTEHHQTFHTWFWVSQGTAHQL